MARISFSICTIPEDLWFGNSVPPIKPRTSILHGSCGGVDLLCACAFDGAIQRGEKLTIMPQSKENADLGREKVFNGHLFRRTITTWDDGTSDCGSQSLTVATKRCLDRERNVRRRKARAMMISSLHAMTNYLRIVLLVPVLLIELSIFLKKRRKPGIEMDRGSLMVVLLGAALSIAVFFLFAFSPVGRLSAWVSYIGFLIVIFGFFLRQWAIRTLGPDFTPTVSSGENHAISTAGPYRYLRHPSYTGLVLEFAGAALSLPNVLALAVMLFCIVAAFQYRIPVEERFLTKQFGDAYVAFKKKTPRIFP
jgi:protein-S-isoprenylcysteine O-methyltransferase